MTHITATETPTETTIRCTCGAGFVMARQDCWLERLLRVFRDRHAKCGVAK